MKRIILTTILACLAGGIAGGLIALVDELSLGAFVLVAAFVFVDTFLPVLIGVFIYQLIKKKIPINNSLLKFGLHILMMLLVFFIGSFLWAGADVIFSNNSNDIIDRIIIDYKRDFLGFVPIIITFSVTIPAIDILLANRSARKQIS